MGITEKILKISKRVFNINTLIIVLLLAWYAFFITVEINLTTADLGRHLKNGELAMEHLSQDLLKTNLYSYTEPDFPFINHHWGSGVIFFQIWKLAGFSGLSLFYILLSLGAFALFFDIARKNTNTITATLISLLLIPLIAHRKEMRPEAISYFFTAVFFWVLWRHRDGKMNKKWFWLLPLISLVWINSHIYFFIGPFLICLFILEQIIKKTKDKGKKIKELTTLLVFISAASLFNPIGLKLLLYPLNIFKNYGYKIVENQSVWFLENMGANVSNLLLFKICFGVLVASFVLMFLINKKRFSIALFILALTFGLMGWLAIRNFTIFGLFALPIISYNIKYFTPGAFKIKTGAVDAIFAALILFVIVPALACSYKHASIKKGIMGIGLLPEINKSAEFFKTNNIQGPIFNNYDIGGYLIYHLYPKTKVFTDNRPEAYPVEFFTEKYVPMQENEETFKAQDEEYNFNAIFFSYRDQTPWAQEFLVNKIGDPNWAPVFADDYAIIFLKRNEKNAELIEKYELPNEMFRTSQ